MSSHKFFSKIDFNQLKRKNFPGSMDPSEIFSFIYLLRKNKIDLVIESGRQYGYSTFFIAKFCKQNNIKFYSIDDCTNKKANLFSRKILKGLNIKYFDYSFFDIIKKILNSTKRKKIALLIDGPKGLQSYVFCYNLLLKFRNIQFIFFDNIFSPLLSKYNSIIFKNIKSFKSLKFEKKTLNYLNHLNLRNKISKNPFNDFGYCDLSDYKNDLLSISFIYFCKLLFEFRRNFKKLYE